VVKIICSSTWACYKNAVFQNSSGNEEWTWDTSGEVQVSQQYTQGFIGNRCTAPNRLVNATHFNPILTPLE
jgi:hypothetical protein